MSKFELFKYMLEVQNSLSIAQIVLSFLFSCLLSILMCVAYKLFYKGSAYSREFNETLYLLAIIIAMVMNVIESNLALSLGMVGALSIIRFRTAIKEPRDIAFVFWSIGIGLSCGAEVYFVGLFGSAVIFISLFAMHFDVFKEDKFIFVVTTNETSIIEDILDKNTKNSRLRLQNVSNAGIESTYEIVLKKGNTKTFLDAIRESNATVKYNLISFDGKLEK